MLQCKITWYFWINPEILVHCKRCLWLKSTTWLYIFSLEISRLKIIVWKCLFLACNYAKLRSILWKPLEMEREREHESERSCQRRDGFRQNEIYLVYKGGWRSPLDSLWLTFSLLLLQLDTSSAACCVHVVFLLVFEGACVSRSTFGQWEGGCLNPQRCLLTGLLTMSLNKFKKKPSRKYL